MTFSISVASTADLLMVTDVGKFGALNLGLNETISNREVTLHKNRTYSTLGIFFLESFLSQTISNAKYIEFR